MRRGSSRKAGTLLLFLLSGVIIGSIVGKILSMYIDHPVFVNQLNWGLNPPITLDLAIISFVFGFTLLINLGTVLGLILALIFYFKS